MHYGIDWAKGPSQTVVVVLYGGRGYGKSFFAKLWLQRRLQDLVSQQLIGRLAAEAIITISINN